MSSPNIVAEAFKLQKELSKIRRAIHQQPELSFQETETAKLIVAELQKIDGMNVKFGVKETGLPTAVVGTLTNGEGPTIAIRADIDALPIKEKNAEEYCSQNEGIMHACGHDAHTAIGIGTAKLLGDLLKKGVMKGTVKFIFQPAEEQTNEEGLTGSPYMIKAGVLDDVDAILALHLDPELPVGEVKIHGGYSMASNDEFEVMISGTGSHAAYPHTGSDPIWMLSFVLQALYGIPSRKLSPLESSVISVTNIEAGSSNNIIPKDVTVRGTMRTYDRETRQSLEKELEGALKIVHSLGGEYDLAIQKGEPALYNDETVSKWIYESVADILPDFKIHSIPYGMGGEDFSYMTEQIPGSMFFIGAAKADWENRGLHTPLFDIDEKVLCYGVAIFTETVMRYLSGVYSLH